MVVGIRRIPAYTLKYTTEANDHHDDHHDDDIHFEISLKFLSSKSTILNGIDHSLESNKLQITLVFNTMHLFLRTCTAGLK